MFRLGAAILYLVALVGMGLTSPIRASDPEGLMQFIASEGFVGRLESDTYGDPNIKILYFDTTFSIYFYGCTAGAKCSSLQFFSG